MGIVKLWKLALPLSDRRNFVHSLLGLPLSHTAPGSFPAASASSWPSYTGSRGQGPPLLPDKPGDNSHTRLNTVGGLRWVWEKPKQFGFKMADLQTVSMHKHLHHCITPRVDVLDLLRSDVLALGQLENVLLPVDDLQRAVLWRDVCTVLLFPATSRLLIRRTQWEAAGTKSDSQLGPIINR